MNRLPREKQISVSTTPHLMFPQAGEGQMKRCISRGRSVRQFAAKVEIDAGLIDVTNA